MSQEEDSFIDRQAKLVGLTLSDEQRPGVERYFALATSMAEPVMSFVLTPLDEAANVYRPQEPLR